MAIQLSDNALKVLERRYLKKNESGKVTESPDEMFRRVARAIAGADKLYGKSDQQVSDLEEAFYRAMAALIYAQFSLPDECRKRIRAALCLFYPADRRFHGIDF